MLRTQRIRDFGSISLSRGDNPLNPNIKTQILICYPYTFSIEEVGEFVEVSIRFIYCDHVLNSHDTLFYKALILRGEI